MRYRIDIVKTKTYSVDGTPVWRTTLLADLSLAGPPEWHGLGGREHALFESVDHLIPLIIEDDKLRMRENADCPVVGPREGDGR